MKLTCSIDHPMPFRVTFARSREYLKKLEGLDIPLDVFVPIGIDTEDIYLSDNIKLAEVEYPEYEFAVYHNYVNMDREPEENIIGKDCFVHPSVVFADGIREVNGPPDKPKVHMKHMGNVVLGGDVRVGPFSVIQRAVFDSTVLEDGCRIDSHCAIGHNVHLGKNVVAASGVGIGGSAQVGNDCMIGANSYVNNTKKVCDNVMIGSGSVVAKDITEPGIYAGTPAKFLKPYVTRFQF